MGLKIKRKAETSFSFSLVKVYSICSVAATPLGYTAIGDHSHVIDRLVTTGSSVFLILWFPVTEVTG